MEEKEISKLLERYKKGTAGLSEKTQLEAWFDKRSAESGWNWTEQESAATGAALKNRIGAQITRHETLKAGRPWMWAAASLLILLVSSILYSRLKQPALSGSAAYTETAVPVGKTSRLVLSDGSVVLLNGGSRLSYPRKFGASRSVTLLEGEAYFDIEHDADKPFIVKANGADIQVLGTAFNVRSYHTMDDIRVTVTRGKVAVKENFHEKNGQAVMLLPDEQVDINKHSGQLKKSHIASANAISWTAGKLIFDNESLYNIASILKNTRNATIVFGQEDLKYVRCTASFEKTDKLEDILFALSRANNLEYTISGKNVLLKRK